MFETKVPSQASWQDAFARFDEANLLHSWQWGVVNETLGHTIERRIIYKDNQPVGLLSAIIKNARRGRYVEIAGGPLIDWNNPELVDAIMQLIRNIGKERNCVFIRLRPQSEDSEHSRQVIQSHGGRISPMHVTADHTTIVDIEQDEDTMLEAMRRQTRYEIRRSKKRSIQVHCDESEHAIQALHALQVETARRQQFIPQPETFLVACKQAFGSSAKVYTATKDDQLLNIALVLQHGNEAAYFEAASTPEARKEPGAYAIVWQAMLDAKAAGMKRFNLWGIAPPDAPHHRYAGVTTFKRGFGGNDVHYTPAHDIPLRQPQYEMVRLFEIVRKKRRKL